MHEASGPSALNGLDESRAARLLLARHAETLDNVEMRLSGWTDADLSDLGHQQVEVLAEHFNRAHGHAAEIYASPLLRARKTAEAIGALTGHTPIFLDDLREMFFGDFEGRAFEELKTVYAELLKGDEDAEVEDFVWPRGEGRLQFRSRVLGVINEISRKHPGEAVGVITHGGVVSVFLTIVHGESSALWRRWHVPNASLTEVLWDPVVQVGSLVRHGDREHLAALEAHEDPWTAEMEARAPSQP